LENCIGWFGEPPEEIILDVEATDDSVRFEGSLPYGFQDGHRLGMSQVLDLSSVKGVLVDMDGLLLDTERIAEKAWLRAAADTGTPLPEGFYFTLIGQSMRVIAERLEEVMPAEKVESYLKAANRHYHHLLHAGDLPVKSGAKGFLEYLQSSRLAYCLATSTYRRLAASKLERAGLAGLIEHRVCGDEVSASKPEPDIYLLAARKINCDPKDCLAVEDSPNGILSALAAGCRVVHVPDLAPVDPDLLEQVAAVFTDLGQLTRQLQATDPAV
jgi:HAD superfamily hydrolase (TIGR01509 family)